MGARYAPMSTFTLVHVLISLAAILAGFVVVAGFITARSCPRWTTFYLVMTFLTSATGFFFPFHHFTPAHGVGILSLIVLAVAAYGLYARKLGGAWRRIYAACAVFALYLNFFVLVVQLFQKVPALNALAPTQKEPPFVIAQSVTLLVFVALGIASTVRSRLQPVPGV